ncbi:hypothetical protein J2T58_002236 [Methanocalculus alkaliphilus]|uniref:hypothetical protein n=1 Tax=Methanocalculus alkaliphilus TaxID=768730 RepID=UPI00209E1503|nr:hypothetical protein [Methanocalculus alkaliphilus]MCP1716359.1 hypothetical protein [Methanocalculus alkaliphilus]
MPGEADRPLIKTTTQPGHPLENGGIERYKKITRLTAPEDFILDLAEKDLEELY